MLNYSCPERPWSIPLLFIHRMPSFAPIWNQLCSDGFVSSKTSAEINRLLANSVNKKKKRKLVEDTQQQQQQQDLKVDAEKEEPGVRVEGEEAERPTAAKKRGAMLGVGRKTQLLEDPTQPFTLDFDLQEPILTLLAEDEISTLYIRHVTMTPEAKARVKSYGKQGTFAHLSTSYVRNARLTVALSNNRCRTGPLRTKRQETARPPLSKIHRPSRTWHP